MPVRQLKKQLTARDVTELLAAERLGLIPDPWMQTGMICKTVYDVAPKDEKAPRVQAEDFRVRYR